MYERKVFRSLTVYGAVSFGAVAAAPDIIAFLALPPWSFTALLIVLAIGLPAVIWVSWNFDFLLQGALATADPTVASPPALDDGAVGQATTVGEERAGRPLLSRWALPVAAVAAVAFITTVVLIGGDDRGGPRVLAWSSLGSATQEGLGTDVGRLIHQPLEWLVGADVIRAAPGSVGSLREGLREAKVEGAQYLLVTELSALEASPMLSVGLYRVSSGERLFRSTGGGTLESLEEATGRLSLRVAQALATVEDIRLNARPEVLGGTSSPVALAQFLESRQAFAKVDFDRTAGALHRAIQADSSFLPAYYRLAVVERWRWDYPAGLAAIDAAMARPGVPPRWQAILAAQRAYLLRDVVPAITGFEEVTLHYPELADGWLGLGEALFHYGGFAGSRPADARAALARALRSDSLIAPIGHHVAELAMYRGDYEGARRAIEGMAATHPVRPVMELALSLRTSSAKERPEVLASIGQRDLRTVSLLVAHFAFDPRERGTVWEVAGQLVESDRSPEDRLRGAQYRLIAASNEAQWDTALESWRALESREDFDPWIVHAHQAGRDTPEAEKMLEWADRQLEDGRIPNFQSPLNSDNRRAFYALVHEAVIGSDTARIQRLLGAIERTRTPEPTDPGPNVLAAALRARLALSRGDTAAAIDELGLATARTFEPFVTFYPMATMAPERLLLIRLARAVDRPALAERWSRSFYESMSFGDLIYQSSVDELGAAAPGRRPDSSEGGIP
jgi:hypothetical protein